RRHTRSKRDWSADVCSSDLTIALSILSTDESHFSFNSFIVIPSASKDSFSLPIISCNSAKKRTSTIVHLLLRWNSLFIRRLFFRSEERRVGKECGVRLWSDQ